MLPKPMVNRREELENHLKFLFSGANASNRDGSLRMMMSNQQAQEDKFPDSSSPCLVDRFLCEICDTRFKNKQGLNQHMGKMHNLSLKTNNCSYCEKSFKQKYALKFHIRQVHEKTTRTNCEVCGKSFYNKYEARKHLRNKH